MLIFYFITIAFDDSATQTDWSGGDGIYGPVLDWGNEFYVETDIDYSYNPYILILQKTMLVIPTEHTLDGNFNGASSVTSADVNGDGYMDVLGAAWIAWDITWWDLQGYTEGSLESSCLYLQNDPGWGTIDWKAGLLPGTSVSFQVRSCDSPDISGMGAWSDTLHNPCSLLGLLTEGDSYFQYKAILQSSIPTATPILNDVTISWYPVSIGETTEPIPPAIALLPIAPNPVTGSPVIRFGLPEPASVHLSIFDLSGRLISDITGDEYSPGYHDVLLEHLSPGVYFCRMISGDFQEAQRFVVIK